MRVLSPHRIVVESRRQRSLDEEFLETLGSALFRLARFVLRHSTGLVIIPYGLWTLAYNYGPAAAIAPPGAAAVTRAVWAAAHWPSFNC